jgi:hypothetical protein
MAIGANSYGSTDDVLAFTRHLLDGETTFNSTTRPTLTEIEGMVDRASAALNVALAGAGLSVPVAQVDAKLACDEWVIARVVGMAELTRQAQGWSGDEGSRSAGFLSLLDSALDFARQHALAFRRLGCAAADPPSQGLAFTGETAEGDRADPDDDSLRPPRFSRGMFEE